MTWTGIVHDVGAAGVNLRSTPQVFSATSRDTAARGARLPIVCGQTGDAVGEGAQRTATWLRTTDNLYVSLLYVRVEGRQNIASCGGQDMPLLSLTDPSPPAAPGSTPGSVSGPAPGAVPGSPASGGSSGGGGQTSVSAHGAPVLGGAPARGQGEVGAGSARVGNGSGNGSGNATNGGSGSPGGSGGFGNGSPLIDGSDNTVHDSPDVVIAGAPTGDIPHSTHNSHVDPDVTPVG